jgi:hypothetical protein
MDPVAEQEYLGIAFHNRRLKAARFSHWDSQRRISGLALRMTLPGRHFVHLDFHPYG